MNFELHSSEQVAHLLGIEVDTLYRYARKGHIRAMKVGKAWRFSDADLQEFFQRQRYLSKPREIKAALLPDILRFAAAEGGRKAAISFQGVEASYAELDAASDQLADNLLNAGVVPGDRVLMLLSTSVEFVIACFAVWKAGAVLVPEDPATVDEDLRHILRDCVPQALIADFSAAQRLDVRHHGLENVRVVYVKDRAFRPPGLDGVRVESLDAVLEGKTTPAVLRFNGAGPEDIASIFYTTKAGAAPKGVIHTHESWLAGAAFMRDYHALTKQDSIVVPLPLHQPLAFRQILGYVSAGAQIILAPDIYQGIKLMKARRPSAAALMPANVNILLENFGPALRELAATLRYIEIGSAPLPPGCLDRLHSLLPNTLLHLPYGLTQGRLGFLRPGSDGMRVAQIAPDVQIKVVDEKRHELPCGHAGQILVKGPGLIKGYWGQSQDEVDALKRDGFYTGDLGMMDERGDVALLGRTGELLFSLPRSATPPRRKGGAKVAPETGKSEAPDALPETRPQDAPKSALVVA